MSDRQLFPHFICRVAGVPVGGLEDLAAVESVASYRALRDARYSGLSLGNRTPSFELAIGRRSTMKKVQRKLQLRRETLQPLGAHTLEQVYGGSLTVPIKDTIVRPTDGCGTPTS